jgi:membrane protease YdiL (CAAX protease family)
MCRHPLLSFFLLANLLSWATWGPLAAAGLGWSTLQAPPYLHLLGGLGPLVAALVVTAACDGRDGLRLLADRCVRVKGRFGWIVLAVTAPVLLLVAAALAVSVAGQGQVAMADIGRSVEYSELGRGTYWVANIICYGFGEEVGWRGFALPRLQARSTALTSALLGGAAWAGWHLPLFAFASGFSSMGLGGAFGWLSSMLTGSILMASLFNSSGGSVLAVALFHGVLDIVMSSPLGGPLPSVMGAVITICGLAVPFVYGRENLSRVPRVRDAAGPRALDR